MRRRRWIAVAMLAGLLAASGPAGAAEVQVRSRHERFPVAGGESFLWLTPQQMMVLAVRGPTQLGLRLRQVLTPGRPAGPVDLTVVRDDAEQGTVRFRVPAGEGELSGEVLVRIDVPAGAHTYRLLVSGPERGVVIEPFSGSIAAGREAIVATPGGDRAPVGPGPRRRIRQRHPAPKLRAQPPEELPELALAERPAETPETTRIEHRPRSGGLRLNPGAWTAGSLAGALLLGGTALAISSGVQAARAEDEPVQVRAGAYYDRAERSGRASAVLFGLAGAALITAVVLQFTASPADRPADPPSGGPAAMWSW